MRTRGTVINIAVWEPPVTLDMQKIARKERRYTGVATYGKDDNPKVITAIDAIGSPRGCGFESISCTLGHVNEGIANQ